MVTNCSHFFENNLVYFNYKRLLFDSSKLILRLLNILNKIFKISSTRIIQSIHFQNKMNAKQRLEKVIKMRKHLKQRKRQKILQQTVQHEEPVRNVPNLNSSKKPKKSQETEYKTFLFGSKFSPISESLWRSNKVCCCCCCCFFLKFFLIFF